MTVRSKYGRRLMDAIEGFKLYLSVAEKDMLNYATPPDKTPEIFEKYLPYAVALDVENEWAEKFQYVLQYAGHEGRSYYPSWYNDPGMTSFSAATFTSALSSTLSSSVSSSSSSGSSGSSGGGGGGGGGGGW